MDLVGREEGERSKRGRGVGEGGIPLQVARFSRGDVVSCHFVGRSTESESESSVGDH